MQKKKCLCRDLIIKSICCVFLYALLPVSSVFGQEQDYKKTRVTLNVKDMKLNDVLDTLASVAKVRFFYNHSQVDVNKKVSFNVKDRELDYVLMLALGDQPVSVEYQVNRVVVLKYQKPTQGVTIYKISGIVIDASTKEPLPGASIILKENKGMGVVTDFDGKFFIEVPQGTSALLVSFVGYEEETVNVTGGNMENLEIKLTEKTTEIEDVVVTGMAPRKVESFSGGYVSVKGSELKKISPNNLLKALQVFDPSFRIVENNNAGSNPNAMPEFRLRGDVQLGNGGVDANSMEMMMGDYSQRPNMPLFVLDGFETTLQRIVDLDPERVESITILKDAAATAIYGSKASNGVLVVETKKPLPGALNISYSMNMGISVPDLSDYNLMDAEEKLEYERMAGVFSTTSQLNYYNKYKEEILRGVDTYWLSEPLRTAVTHRHTLTMEGGDEALRYNLGINYSREPGVMKESGRNSMGLNLSLQYRRKKWNIQNQLSLTNVRGDNSPYGSFSQYTKLNPYYRKTDENGRYTSLLDQKKLPGEGGGTVNIVNPLYNLLWKYKDFTENFSVVDNFNIECAILDNLRVSAGASTTKGTSRMEVFKSMNHTDFLAEQDLTRKGSYNKSTGDNVSWSVNASVNYNYTKDKHLLSLFGRWNVDESKSNSVNLSAMGFPNDNMDDFLFAYEMEDRVSGTESTSRTVGIIGQVSYMYDMRFSVDFSIRGDLSSQFGANTGMAPFWAAGARWNLHREKWLQNTIISNLVLRGSYGVTGSQSYSPYQAKETYSYDDLLFPYPSSDILGAQLKGMGNPDLGWSTTENRSLAVEIGLWNSRVNASFSYYNNYTDELLLDYNMAPSTGFATKTMNVGAVENEGYDISLSVMPIQDYERQIQWSVSMNGSHNRNVIKKISNEMKAMNQKNLEKKNGSPEAIYEEGKSTTQLFVVPSLGIDPATGQEVFLNRNGEKTYIWDPLDKVAIGDTEPKLRGAVSSAFTYKNWSVSLACSYEFGGWWYNQTLVDKIENSSAAYNLDRRALSHRWSENNRDARYKAIKMTNQDTGMSSRFAQKRNEFSFTSLAVGYRFDPKNFKFLQACRIASVSLNATMEELGRISSIRTERGLDYPFARTFSVSLSVLFN